MMPVDASVLQGPSMAAAFPVPAPGQYAVQLFFSELYFQSAGQRIFDLDIAGLPALSCFDIFLAAGGPDRGIVATFLVRPGNGCWWHDACRYGPGTCMLMITYLEACMCIYHFTYFFKGCDVRLVKVMNCYFNNMVFKGLGLLAVDAGSARWG